MLLSRRKLILGMAASGACWASAAAAGTQVAGGHAFGSSWRVTTDPRADLAGIRSIIDGIVAQVDADMSPYRPGSHLSRFNENTTDDWQPMPAALCQVASDALRIAHQTQGAFDPTVGPIVARFGFGPIKGGSGSFQDIDVGSDALSKGAPHLTLDLCGIAKGYALDQMANALRSAGVKNALIEVGGEVAAIGHHPSGRDWQVAVADPTASDFRVHKIIQPGTYAVATSGHAANGLQGRASTSHIIDPHLGVPASTALASVTVLAETATEADALATAFCAIGLEDGAALARRLNVSALFVANTHQVMTGVFSKHVLV